MRQSRVRFSDPRKHPASAATWRTRRRRWRASGMPRPDYGNPVRRRCHRLSGRPEADAVSSNGQFHPMGKRRAYACQECGHHIYPCAGTIFHKSSTKLSAWFFAIYLMTSTRHGVAAKEIERQTGVTYKPLGASVTSCGNLWRPLTQTSAARFRVTSNAIFFLLPKSGIP
jgi:hypothetical protein